VLKKLLVLSYKRPPARSVDASPFVAEYGIKNPLPEAVGVKSMDTALVEGVVPFEMLEIAPFASTVMFVLVKEPTGIALNAVLCMVASGKVSVPDCSTVPFKFVVLLNVFIPVHVLFVVKIFDACVVPNDVCSDE
jgi:hypothetical protein